MTKLKAPIKIVGLSKITTNEAAKTQNTIGELWALFAKSNLQTRLNNIISPNVYAVYSDYENKHHGNYQITIGFAVDDNSHIPNDLTAVTIPVAEYKIFTSKSQSPVDIIDTWRTIWQTPTDSLKRSYNVDFEEYTEDKITIHIGC